MRLRIRASLQFPLESVGWQRKLLIGGGTSLLLELLFVGLAYLVSEEAAFGIAPFVVVLNFPVLGYALYLYRGTLRGEMEALPEWADWPGLLRKGLVAFGIGLTYGALPLVTLLLGLGFLVTGGITLFVGMVLIVLGILAGMFLLFFLPMGMAKYLSEGRIEAAFHPGMIWEGINSVLAEYAGAYFLGVGAHILSSLFAAVPYLGPLVWPFLWFFLMLALARLFGGVCAKAA
jgi:hypothetical protein